MAKRGPSERHALDDAAVTRLWNACKTPEDKVLVGLTMMCGMRVGEAVHLQGWWIKTTDSGPEITIPPTMECGCYECLKKTGYWKPKSAAGARTVPVVETLEKDLMDFILKQPGGLGYVRQTGWRKTKKLAVVAKIKYLNVHALRATYATVLAKSGVNAITICYLLGWSRIEVAQHYINIVLAKEESNKIRGSIFTSG